MEAKAGLVAQASDPMALAEIILQLFTFSSQERKEMGINARKYFEENFERELLLNKIIGIFKDE